LAGTGAFRQKCLRQERRRLRRQGYGFLHGAALGPQMPALQVQPSP
jgi:hypothetical protein